MNEYTKCLDETKYISFLIEDNKLLKAYNLWNKNENGYTKCLDETKYMYFLVKDDKLLKAYNVWYK